MFESQHARDFLLAQDFEISMLQNVPYVDLSPLVCQEPPGLYYPLADVQDLLRRIAKRLEVLSPHPKGASCVGISSDFRTVVMARTPSAQFSFDLTNEISRDKPVALKELTHDEMTSALQSLEKAQEIAAAQSRGEVSTAEDLASLLSKCSSPNLVRKALREMGRESMHVSIDNQEAPTGGGAAFPAKLACRVIYKASLSIEAGINERDQTTRVRVITCDPQDEHSIVAKASRADILLDFIEPQDGKFLIAAQFANCKVVADICLTIDSFTGGIAGMTLRKIKNREQILSTLRNQIAQEAFAF